MKKKDILFPLSLISIMFFMSCATSTKGYVGEKKNSNETSRVNCNRTKITVNDKLHEEGVLFVRVDSLIVGSYYKGWPEYLDILPGEREIEFRHGKSWSYQTNYQFGAIGAAISGSSNEKNNAHQHYVVNFDAEIGKTYLFNIKSDSLNLDSAVFTLTEEKSNKEIDYQIRGFEVLKNVKK